MKSCPRHGPRFACNHPADQPVTTVRNHGPGHIEYQSPCSWCPPYNPEAARRLIGVIFGVDPGKVRMPPEEERE